MTQLIQTLNNYSLKPIAEVIVEFFASWWKSLEKALEAEGLRKVQAELRKYRSYRETYDQLSQLTDKELNDIGISRGMIHSVALEAYTDNLLNKKG